MSERASSDAIVCPGGEWAVWQGQWGGTTYDRTTAGRLFKSGFEKPVHEDSRRVAESGGWCNDLGVRCHTGELQ